MRDEITRAYSFIDSMLNGEAIRPYAYEAPFVWREEKSDTFIPSLKELLNDHWREAGQNHDKVPISPDWSRWLKAESRGQSLVVTGRINNRLIGYMIFLMETHINYSTTVYMNTSVYYVHPHYRRRGFFTKMRKLGEEIAASRLKQGEVIEVIQRSKKPEIDRSLEGDGYVFREKVYTKLLEPPHGH